MMNDEFHFLQGEQNFDEWHMMLQSLCRQDGILEVLGTPLQMQSCDPSLKRPAADTGAVTDRSIKSNNNAFCTSTSSIRSSRSGHVISKKRPYRKTKAREVRWTKAPRYRGQATFDLKNNLDRVKEAKSAELMNVTDDPEPISRLVESSSHDRHQVRSRIGSLTPGGSEFPILIPSLSDRLPMGSEMIANDFYFNFDTFVRKENLHPEEGNSENFSTMSQLFDNTVTSNHTNKLTEDVKDIYHDLMRTKDDALQWLELWHHGKSIDWWFPLFKAMYALLKLHQTIFEYANHPTASPILQRLLEKYAMAPSLWQSCVHDFMDVVKISKPGQGTLADVERYLQDTKHVIASLQQSAGHLSQYWESYQAGLDHYLDCLSQIREGRADWSHPEVFLGDSLPDLVGASDVREAHHKENLEAGNLGYHGVNTTASGDSTTKTNECPKIAAAALTGWTVFGQGIAETFDYYSRMFKVLSWTSLPDAVRKFTEFLTNKTLFRPTFCK